MKSEQQKRDEIINYFDNRIFEPALNFARERQNLDILRGVNCTKMRMSKLTSIQMINYFWTTIIGTERSIKFSKILKDNNILRFEDIIDEVRLKFNDDYFNS